MSLGPSAKVVSTSTRELARQWDRTKEAWRDAKSAEFEKEHLQELFASAERASAILEELDKLIAKCRKDFE